MHDSWYYVYMVQSSSRRALYIGVTRSLERRIAEHKSGSFEGFTADYHASRLVYFERFGDIRDAIAREKQLKGLAPSEEGNAGAEIEPFMARPECRVG